MKQSPFKRRDTHEYFKTLLFPVPSWDSIIKNIDRNLSENLEVKIKNNLGIVTHDLSDIAETYSPLELIKKQNPGQIYSAHFYVSLSRVSETFGKHKDVSDVWFWQCQGKTKWTVYENNDEYEYILSPGDVIYVPKQIYHNTQPLTARAGVSFGIDYE